MKKIVSMDQMKQGIADHFDRGGKLMNKLASIQNEQIRDSLMLRYLALQAHENAYLMAVLAACGVKKEDVDLALQVGANAADTALRKAMHNIQDGKGGAG